MTPISPQTGPAATLNAVLRVRRADLNAQLRQVQRAVEGLADIDSALHARVADRLREALDECQAAVDAIDGATDMDAWKKVENSQKCLQLLGRETLAYTEGALLRRHSSDGRFCALADHLLDHFGAVEPRLNWRGFTILAENAFLGDVAEVVRLKYPRSSYWHLPVAAHEFGHFANPNIRIKQRKGSFTGSTYPVEEFLRERWDENDQKKWFHAHEHLADIFATFALGPSYAYYVLFLEVSPRTLRSATTTHPSWNDRVPVILETLNRIVLGGGVTPQVMSDLRGRWQVTLDASTGTKLANIDALRSYVDFLLPLLVKHLNGLHYTSITRAQQLVAHLRGTGLPPNAMVTAPDILNAAWLARLYDVTDEDAAAKIATRATSLLEVGS